MKIIDIVNRDNQTLERCDQEPIHIPGTIQPHGFLISVDSGPDLIVKYCSANCEPLFNKKIAAILGQSFKEFLSSNSCPKLEQHLQDKQFDTSVSCEIAGVQYNVAVHSVGNLFTVELEQFPDGSPSVADQFNQTKRFLRNIQHAESFHEICQSIADETRAITGYDRVMIYKFDKEYNGEVFAESKKSDLSPFLGHHYPHTDIPAQARELYLKNLLRVIVDVDYAPVPVFTLDDPSAKDKQLDMSESILRSVSPIHIQYLKNMSVGATLTVSLIENKKLWGLIACHHYSPRYVPFYTRLAAQLQGHFLTSQMSVRASAEENDLASVLEKKLDQLMADISKSRNFLLDENILREITNVIHATGVAIIRNEEIKTSGTVPAHDQIRELLPWLVSQSDDGNFVSNVLPQQFGPAQQYGRDASGVLYYSLGDSRKDGIIWFRPEMDKTINWAGNPTKTPSTDGMTAALTPRKSFELWQEKVKNKSTEWLQPELNIAVKLAHILQRQFHAMYLEEEEKRYIELTKTLKKANTELANLNWIGTHDLKEPLRKIQIFASTILRDEREVSPKVFDAVTRMQKSATRMQSLITDILQYSKVNAENNEGAFEKVDLNLVLQEVLQELEDDITGRKAAVFIEKLPVITGIRFQLAQLFINLIDNSLKFVDGDKNPKIGISCQEVVIDQVEYHKISLSDNGIGFDETHREKIFDVFQQLHAGKYQGTGIGLAICKKVMENHQGWIKAIGENSGGATFELYFLRASPTIAAQRNIEHPA